MRHEPSEFVGGPLDGRVLEIMTGMTGLPPLDYRVPVPAPQDPEDGADGADPEGAAPPDERVYVYHREPGRGRTRFVYVYDPDGRPHPERPKWPWSKRS